MTPALVVVAVIAAAVGYRLVESRIVTGVYRDRLHSFSSEYEQLRQTYNQAVRRTAVTELLVEDGKLAVRVRDVQGVLQVVPTPFDPSGEIYVDYVVIDGRLWIRRVFDARTPPEKGVLIDPKLADIDWHNGHVPYGKAVYRSLTEGRWVVTVTGDGSLGLGKAQGEPPTLSPPPQVRDYDQLEREIEADVERIGVGDVLQQVFGSEH